MNTNKTHKDVFDSLFEKHMNDEAFINSSISDFGKMVKDAIHDEALKNGYDSLSEMIHNEIYDSRYDMFIHSIQSPAYLTRHQELYQNGYEDALKRYRQQAELNRTNLCPLEKIIQMEINGGANLKQDSYGQGYLDGLRFIQKNLLQSKSVMMDKVNQALIDAMKKK